MTEIDLYQVDAFTHQPFQGNPAAICPLDSWLDDELMQSLAAENNLAETAFCVAGPKPGEYDLRWFTPTTEVELCGHATLASAWVVFHEIRTELDTVHFHTRSGKLTVYRDGDWLRMAMPRYQPQACDAPAELLRGLGIRPDECYSGPNYLAVYPQQADIESMSPDMRMLSTIEDRAFIVTAPADDGSADFVSRVFAPNFGIDEDPVTGSAHCMLTPYWSERLDKSKLRARQISPRGGLLICECQGDSVMLSGQAVKVMQGRVYLQD